MSTSNITPPNPWANPPVSEKTKNERIFKEHVKQAKAWFADGVSLRAIFENYASLGYSASIATFRKAWTKAMETAPQVTHAMPTSTAAAQVEN